MIVYFNIKTRNEVETIDEFNSKDFKDIREFNHEVSRCYREYHLGGTNVYRSSRCTNEWSKK